MDAGVIGGLAGGVLGIAGGAVGTWFGIRSALGPREREFLIRVSALAWSLVLLFMGCLFLLPRPYGWFLWIPYGIALPFAARWANRRQMQIREEERAPEQPSRS